MRVSAMAEATIECYAEAELESDGKVIQICPVCRKDINEGPYAPIAPGDVNR